MTTTDRRTAAALLTAILVVAPAFGDALSIDKAKVEFLERGRDGAARHRFLLKGTLASRAAVQGFDPSLHALRIEVAGTAVIDVPAGTDPEGFRSVTRRGTLRMWRYRSKGPPGAQGKVKVVLHADDGRVVVRIRKAGLAAIAAHGPTDVTAAVEVGTARDEGSFTFTVVRDRPPARWRFPTPPPHDGPVPFTSIVAGSLAATPRPELEVARNGQELAALWSALSNPAELPEMDFTREMVVVISVLIEGAGVWGPPTIDVTAARALGGRLELDWNLRGCEWKLCPGAPAPVMCAQDTPFHVLRIARTDTVPRLRQGPVIGVCP